MSRPDRIFSPAERAAIDAAVAAAERGTQAEIVPVVAGSSGRYDRAEDLFGLLLAVLGLCGGWCLRSALPDPAWGATGASPWELVAAVTVVLGGFVSGAWLAGRFPALRTPFVARGEMQEEVERRALAVFQQQRLRATASGTGVLIYVSLYERMVRVIGDEAVSAKLQAGDWDSICARVVEGMRAGAPERGLEQAIALAGELLAQHFPAEAGGRRELPDALVLLD